MPSRCTTAATGWCAPVCDAPGYPTSAVLAAAEDATARQTAADYPVCAAVRTGQFTDFHAAQWPHRTLPVTGTLTCARSGPGAVPRP